MRQETQVKQRVATCLECERSIPIGRNVDVDDMIVCRHCGTNFVVLELSPIEIDYAEEDWDDDDWEDDDYENEDDDD